MQFNTLGSTIDTEMALYGPEGKLLRENDNFMKQDKVPLPSHQISRREPTTSRLGNITQFSGEGFTLERPQQQQPISFLIGGRTGQESFCSRVDPRRASGRWRAVVQLEITSWIRLTPIQMESPIPWSWSLEPIPTMR